MRTKCRSIATFHRPIHSHWSLPLKLQIDQNETVTFKIVVRDQSVGICMLTVETLLDLIRTVNLALVFIYSNTLFMGQYSYHISTPNNTGMRGIEG